MDKKYLDRLEREFSKLDSAFTLQEHTLTATELEAALKRGREYHAIALQLSVRQLASRLKGFYQAVIRRRPASKRPLSTNASSSNG